MNGLLVTALLVPATTLAAPVTDELRWTRGPGAEQCIDQASLIAAVELRLGRPLHVGDGPVARVIEGRVDPIPDGYRVRISVEDEQHASLGERELVGSGADCRDLDDKLILVIALIIDPEGGASVPASKPTPTATPEPRVPLPARSVPAIAVGPAAAGSRSSVVLGISGSAVVGVLPGPGFLGGLSLAVDRARMPAIAISISTWAPDREVVAAGGVQFAALSTGAEVCPRLWTYRGIVTLVCLGGEVARVAATGVDFDVNDRVIDWIVDATGELGVTIPIFDRWSASAGIGGWVPFIRPRFVYAEGSSTQAIFQPSAAAGVIRIGLGIRL